MKNSNDTIWNRTSDLPICSTAPYPLCYRGHHLCVQYNKGTLSENVAVLRPREKMWVDLFSQSLIYRMLYYAVQLE